MADKTGIEWTDATWTPIRARWFEIQSDGSGKERVGWHCEHVSEGCRNCYAEAINNRLGTGLDFKPGNLFRQDKVGYVNGDAKLFLDENMLLAPLRWKKSRMIFVCSMTDLFADFVSDAWIDRVFAVMALSPQHTYQILTKRSRRMRAYVLGEGVQGRIARVLLDAVIEGSIPETTLNSETWPVRSIGADIDEPDDVALRSWPLPNVWLGVSAEDQRRADERVPDLLATPAAIRFVSAEPLLGPIDFRLPPPVQVHHHPDNVASEALSALVRAASAKLRGPTLNQIIVGGESGKGARPMHPGWARSIRDQCAAVGTAFFFKQWGEWHPHSPKAGGDLGGDVRRGHVEIVHPSARGIVEIAEATGGRSTEPGSRYMARIGKKAAGRLLDGVEHNAMPAVRR